MKVYLAGPWKDRATMPKIATLIESFNFTITHKWWEAEDTPEGERSTTILRKQAELDVQGVVDADLVVVINSSKSEGKALEQGIAIASNKAIIIVGKRGEHSNNVFHYLPSYRWVDDLVGLSEALKTIQWLLKRG